MGCTAKHTKYQPTDKEFRCPKCKAKVGDFAIDEPLETVDEDCTKLHVGEWLYCYKCSYGISAVVFTRQLMKVKNLVPCPCCKGTGLVAGTKAKP